MTPERRGHARSVHNTELQDSDGCLAPRKAARCCSVCSFSLALSPFCLSFFRLLSLSLALSLSRACSPAKWPRRSSTVRGAATVGCEEFERLPALEKPVRGAPVRGFELPGCKDSPSQRSEARGERRGGCYLAL
eukprot:1386983-Rhodomonas_salina.1